MDAELESIGDKEHAALTSCSPFLNRCIALADCSITLLAQIVKAVLAEQPPIHAESRFACTLLLLRTTDDLRCCVLMAQRGYPLQTGAMAATIFETYYTITYIEQNDERAKAWLQPTRPYGVFPDLRQQMDEWRKRFDFPGSDTVKSVDDEYRTYSQLCMAKHAHALAQRPISTFVEGGVQYCNNGPSTSADAERSSCYALLHAVRYSNMAAQLFTVLHVPGDLSTKAMGWVQRVATYFDLVHRDHLQRWGGPDPFVGQWKYRPRKKTKG